MALNFLRGKVGHAPADDGNGFAIGESDSRVFNCPACARPLADGTSKCPGCGSRLIMGVTLKRAGAILALGVAIGFLLGGAVTAAAVGVLLPAATAAPAVVPSTPVVPAASGLPAPIELPPAVTGLPTSAMSALSGTAVVNGRIAVDAATLSKALAKRGDTTIDLARALRSLSADAALGIDLAGRLAPWQDAKPVMTQLESFYQSMATTAHSGLNASFNDTAAYRKAASRMLTVLGKLGGVDAASRRLATGVDLELPPVAYPGSEAANPASPAPSTAP